MHRGIDDWVPPEPSTATLSSKAQGLPQLDPMRVLSHLEDSLDVRDAYIEELGDLAARLAASYAENTATDVSTEASSDFFGCVRGLRECTLVAADLAHFLANRAWNTSRGTLALACLIGPDSAGSRLAKAGHDVLDILQNTEPPTLSDLLDSGHWSLVSSETGLPDPLMAGLTFSGRPMSDQVLSARQKRGIAPSIPTSQVRQLFSQVVYWQGLQTSLEASKEAAAAFERAIAESNDRLAAWKVQKASEEHCSKLESILKEIAAEEENAEDATLRLKDLRREEIELNDRVEYWEEKVLSSQALQSNLTRLRTQTKSHVLSMELAQEQLEEREEELKQKQDEEAELLEVLATLQQGGGKEDQTQNAADTIAATQSEPSVPPKETKPAEGPKETGPIDLPKEPSTEDLMRSAWTAAAAVASLTPDGAAEPMPVSVEEMMDVQAAKAKHGPDSLEMGRAAAAAGISSLYLWLKAEGDMADPAVCAAATQLLVESVRMHRAWLGPLHPTVFLLQTYTQAATMLSMKGSDFLVEDAEAEVAASIKAHGSGSKEAGEMAAAGGLALMLQGHGGEGCELLSTAMDTMAALLGPKSGAAVGIGAAMGGTCTPKAGSRRPMRAAAKATAPTDLPKEPTTEDLMRSAWTAAAAVASLTSDGASEPMPVSVEEMMDVQAAKARHGPDSLEMGRAAAAAGISSLYLWLKAEGDMADPAVCTAATQLLVESVRMHRAWLGPLHPTVFLLQTYTQAATMLSKKGSDFSVEDAEAEVAAAIKAHGSGSKEAGEMAAAGGLALMLQGHGGEGCELLSKAMDTMIALLGPKSGAAVGIGAAMGGTCTPKAGSRRPMRAAAKATAPTDLPKEPTTEDLMRSAWTAAAAVASLTSDGASEPMPVSVEEMMDVQAAKARHGPDSLEMGRAAAAAGISSLYLWLKAEGDMADPAVCTAATQLLVESVRMHRAWLGPLHPTVFLLQTYTQAATMLSKKGSDFSVEDAEAEVAAAIKAHGSGSKEAGEMAAAGGLALMLQGHGGEGCELLSKAMDTMIALLGPKSGAAVGIGAAMGGTCTPKAGSRRPMRAAPKATAPTDLPKEPTTEDLMRSAWTAAAAVASLTPDGAAEPMPVSVEEMMDVQAAKAKHGPDSLEMGRAAAAAGISSLYLWLKAEGDMADPAVCEAATQLLVESVRMHRAWLGPLHPTVFLLQTYTQAATMLSKKGSDFSVEDAEAEVAAAIKAHGSGSKEAGEMAAAGGLALMLQGHGGEGCELLSKAMDTMIALLGPKSGAAVGIGAAMGGTCTPKAGSRRPMRAAAKATAPTDLPKEPTTEDLMRSAWTAAAAVASLTSDGASEPMPVSVEEMMDVQAAKARHGPDSLEMGRAAAAAGISSLYLWLKAEGDMADPAVCTAATQLLVESVRMHRAWLGPLHPTVFLLQTYTQAATMLSKKGSDFSVEDAEAEVAAAIKAHGSGSKEAGEMAAAGGLALMLQGHGGEGCELLSKAMDTMIALLGPKSGAAVGIGAAMGGTCTPKAGSRRPMRAAPKATAPTDLPKEPTTEDLMRSAWTAAAAVASLTPDGAAEPMPVSVEEMMDVQAAKAKHGPDSLEMGRAAAAAGISSLYLWLKAEGDMADPAVCEAATQLLVESVRMHRAWLGPLHPTVFLLQTYTQAATMLSMKGSNFSVEDAEEEVAAVIKAHGSGSKEAGEMAAAGGLALMLQGHGGEGCELLSKAMDTMAALLGPKSGAAVGIGAAMGGTCTPKAGSRRPMRAAPASTAPTDLPKEPSTEDLMRSAWTAAAAVASLTPDGAAEPMPVSVEEMMDVQAAKAKHGPDSLEMGRAAAAAGISSLYLWLKAEGDMADPAVCTAATQLLVESVRMHRAWLGPLHPTVFLLQTYTQAATMLSMKGSDFSVEDAEAEVAAAIKAHGSGSKEAGEMAAAGGLALMLQGHGGEGCELLSKAMDTMAALLGPKSGAAVGIGAAMGGTCTPKAGSRRPMRAAPASTAPTDLPKEPSTKDLMRSAWTAAAAVASLTSDGASEPMPVSVEEMMDVQAAKAKHGPDSLEMGRAAAAAGISSLYLWLKAEGDMADPAVCTAATQLLVESVRMHRAWLGPLHPTVFLLQTYTMAATMLSMKGSDFSVEDAEAEVAAAIKAHGSGSKEAGEMAAAGGLALMLQGHGGEGCELLSTAMDTMIALVGPKSGAAVGIGAAMGGTCTPKAGSRRPMRAAAKATAPTDLPKEPSTEDLMRSAWTAAAAVASLTPDGASEPMPVSVEEMMDVQAAKAKHGPDSLEMGRAAAAAGISSLYLWLKAEGDMADPAVCAAATQLLVESVRMHRAWLGPLHPTVFLLQTYTQAATMLSMKGSDFSVEDAEAEVAAAIKAHGSGSKETGEMAAAGGLALMLQGHGGEGCELLSKAMDTMIALLGPKSGAAVGIGAAMGGTCTPKAGSRRPMRAAPKATAPTDLPKEPTIEDLMRSAWTAAAAVASLTPDGASESVSVEEMMDVQAAKAKHGPDSLEMGRAAAAAGISSLYLWLKAEGDMADPAVCTAATQLLVESVRMHRAWLGPLHPTVFLLQTYTMAATMLSKKGGSFSVEDAEAEVAARMPGSKEAGEMAAAGGLALMLQGVGKVGCELLSKAMDTMTALLGPNSGPVVGIVAAMGGTCTP